MTLLFALLLLAGAGILAFSAGRTGVVEQRISNNEQQALEAEQAAESGLDFALAWLGSQVWTSDMQPPRAPPSQAASGQVYDVLLALSPAEGGICVHSTALGADDARLTASADACISQSGLFAVTPQTRMPPPLLLGGCMTSAPERSEVLLAGDASVAAATGDRAGPGCLPLGAIEPSTWTDRDGNRVLTPDEQGPSADYRRARFAGCPGSDCAWRQVFELPLAQAIALAESAGQVFDGHIPCGAPSAPGIYVIRRSGPIGALDLTGICSGEDGVDDRTIGTPTRPILLIVPELGGCASFTEDLTIHGIVYFASGCSGQTWQGARIQGAVIWEGDAQGPGEGSTFIETDFGTGAALNAAFQVITDAARIPGTWRDWD